MNQNLQTNYIGYWKTNFPDCPYPLPVANTVTPEELSEALSLLNNIKSSIKTRTLYTKGVSPCRLCGASNGSQEYVVTKYSRSGNPMVRWCIPEGYSHYLMDHQVTPDLAALREAAQYC